MTLQAPMIQGRTEGYERKSVIIYRTYGHLQSSNNKVNEFVYITTWRAPDFLLGVRMVGGLGAHRLSTTQGRERLILQRPIYDHEPDLKICC